MNELTGWLAAMDEEDRQFLKRFVLASGSLKDLAAQYGISYPTIRARLDRFIAKIKAFDESKTDDAFERLLRVKLAEGAIGAGDAKLLLAAHRASLKRKEKR